MDRRAQGRAFFSEGICEILLTVSMVLWHYVIEAREVQKQRVIARE